MPARKSFWKDARDAPEKLGNFPRGEYALHFSPVENAASILRNGIISHGFARRTGLDINTNRGQMAASLKRGLKN